MADCNYGAAISLSREVPPPPRHHQHHPTSDDDDSSDHSPRPMRALSAIGTTIPGAPAPAPSSSSLNPRAPTPARRHRKSSSSTTSGAPTHELVLAKSVLVQVPRRARGRPMGSKNRPKPPIVITRDNESAIKASILEISAGSDIIEAVITFAHRNNVGVTVLSGTGSVSNVTLHHPVAQAPTLSLHGPFCLLSLSGSVLGSFSSTTSLAGSVYGHSSYSFGITLAGAQGQVFGGIVAGKVTAASNVVLVTATYSNSTYSRLPSENDQEEAEDKKPVVHGGGMVTVAAAGGRGGGVSEASPVTTSGMNVNLYGGGAAATQPNSSPLISQISHDEIVHWGPPPPPPPSRPPYR